MAPEQAGGPSAAIDARTDVYGLGAILYELLTGRPPFQAESPLLTLEQVVQSDPAPPRLLNADVPRDVDTVCLKCLHKEPGRRYSSAAALADDLGRWLRGESVRARPVSLAGRAWRWCRRRPMVASLTSALGLAVFIGVAGIVYQWRMAEAARREAEASDAQTQRLLSELLQPVQGASYRILNSRRVSHIDVLLQAEAHFQGLLDKAPGDTRARIALTDLRANLAAYYGQRGQMTEMDASLQRAQDLWEPLVRENPRSQVSRDWLANIYLCQSEAAARQGQKARSLLLTLRAVALWQELADEHPGDLALMKNLAVGHTLLLGYRDSLTHGREFLRVLEDEEKTLRGRLAGGDPPGTTVRKGLALTLLLQGEVHVGMRARHKAAPCYREAYERYTKLPEERAPDPTAWLTRALCCCRLMAGQSSSPYYAEAVALFERASRHLEELAARTNADDEDLRRPLLETYGSLAACHWEAGRVDEARQVFQERVQPLLASVSGTGGDCPLGIWPMTYLYRLMNPLEKENPSACREVAREAAALIERFADDPLRDGTLTEEVARHSLALAPLLCRLGCPAESLRLAERGRRLYAALRQAAPDMVDHSNGLIEGWVRIAKARSAMGQRDEAMAALRESAAVQRQVLAQAPSVPFYRQQLSRRYEQLAHFGGLWGDRATVADALREREKLWPDNADELREVSDDFRKLADAVSQGREQLLPEEEAERQYYLAASERTRRAANALVQKQ
jgi:tetratricopeptide (TPR) repeat protein